jgi:predicted short-subunit dehydrogenase-like oxidoreductase (DUF2520 family)
MPRKDRRPSRVVIVGFGRLGGAIGLALGKAAWPVAVLTRSGDGVRRAVQHGLKLAEHEDLRAAELCVLAVPDVAIASAAALVEDDLSAGCALVHLSGALGLSAFASGLARRPLGTFHPLVAVSDPEDGLAGHAVAVAATDRALIPVLERLARTLGLAPISVPESGRPAYHAGAVMSAGLLVALAEAAVSALEHAGLDRDTALESLLPLMSSALRGVQARGLEKGLTGPVVRGDVGVVQAHLEALPPELGGIYRLLSRRALRLAGTLPAETRLALERLLM